MAIYKVSQRFNNGTAKNYASVDTTALVMQSLIDAAPKGVSAFGATLTGTTGVARAVPTAYVRARVICKDKTNQVNSAAFVNIKYGKTTLDHAAIVTALQGKINVPNGTTCDLVTVRNWKKVGA